MPAAAPQSAASIVKAPKQEAEGVTIGPFESRRLSSQRSYSICRHPRSHRRWRRSGRSTTGPWETQRRSRPRVAIRSSATAACGQHAVDHAGGEDRERLAATPRLRRAVAVRAAGQLWRAGDEPAEGRARRAARGRRARAVPRGRAAPACAATSGRCRRCSRICRGSGMSTGQISWQALHCVQSVLGRSASVEAVMERREHEADRAVVDVPELVTADGHERRAGVGARAAADAGERVAKDAGRRACARGRCRGSRSASRAGRGRRSSATARCPPTATGR